MKLLGTTNLIKNSLFSMAFLLFTATMAFAQVDVTISFTESDGTTPIEGGVIKYYNGGWQTLGTTNASGEVEANIPGGNYSFELTHGGLTNQKTANVSVDPNVLFSTVSVTVELRDSNGDLLAESATAKYYGGGWKTIGTSETGSITTELLPQNTSFSISHKGLSRQIDQNTSSDGTVTFATTNVHFTFNSCSGDSLSGGSVKYYGGGWKTLDSLTNGNLHAELLPRNIHFKLDYEGGNQQVTQNTSVTSVVRFQTGTVNSDIVSQYYAGGWKAYTDDNQILPGNYTFGFNNGDSNANKVVSAGYTLHLPEGTYTECVAVDRADLSLTASVSEVAPDAGSTVDYRFVVHNAGEDAATGIEVEVAYEDDQLSEDSGSGDGTWNNGTWQIANLAVGDSAVYSMTFDVDTSGVIVMTGQVVASDQEDPNSEVNNADVSEDDYFSLTITGGQATGGGGAGLESNGTLAMALGQRMFMQHRRGMPAAKYEASRGIMFSSEQPLLVAAGVGGFTETGILDLIPTSGPEASTALSVTPHDLIGVTNARSVVAVDYNRADNRRLAGIFGVSTSPDTLYEHTKVVCDRLIGATLESVEIVYVEGQPFVLTQLRHPNGQLDYAITFLGVRNGTDYQIDSRFTQNEYDLPAGEELLTFQVWSVSKDYTAALVAGILTSMDESGAVTYNNAQTEANPVFVKRGFFKNGVLTLDVYNPIGNHSVTLTGSIAYTEGGEREAFETVAAIPNQPNGQQSVEVEIDLGDVFDASLVLTNDSSEVFDQLYYSDGQWGYNYDPEGAEIFAFNSELGSAPDAEGSYNVQRSASLSGEVTTWVSMYRFLQPGGQPIDLEHYAWIEFKASGIGSFELVVAREGIQDWSAQYRTNFDLDQEDITYRINLDKLTAIAGAPEFASHDLTMLSFNPISDGDSTIAFDLNISEVRFGGFGTVAVEDDSRELPDSYNLDQNYPNPFNPVTNIQFALPENTTASVVIYDMLGRQVKVLASGSFSAGVHTVQFDGSQLASGIYFYRLQTPNFVKTKKMIMIK